MLRFLFNFRGRVSVGQFWLFYFCAAICWGLAITAIYAIAGYARIPDPLDGIFFGEQVSAAGWVIFGLLASTYALLVVCFLAVISKRLHDRNRCAWWLLPIYGCVALLAVLDNTVPNSWLVFGDRWPLWNGVMMVMMVFLGLAALWLLVELILPGTRGDNRFGPDPRRIDRPAGPA